MFRKKENRLLNKEENSSKSPLQQISGAYAALISFSKRIFHRFGPREKYFVGIAALIIVVSVFAIGVQVYIAKTSAVPAFGGEYREAIIGLPRFLNPVLASTNDVDRDMVHLIYASLMRYDLEGNLVPDLAKEYTISEDGREYRFTLKDNLRWEDGAPLTAEDVVFTIETIQNPQYSSPLFQSWQGIEVSAEDERTITFRLSSPYPPFLENTTLGILPKHVWQDVSPKNFVLADLNQKPIGSGRYKVEKLLKDPSGFISSYTLERNALYHGQKPFIDKIIFKFFSDEDEAVKAYNAKSVDGISFASPVTLKDIQNTETANIHEFKMPRYFAIFINQDQNEALESRQVREALSLAT
ncbi:MAG: ABC transporter substrate-binding protein, partial [Candidatus Spechtbacterales bacterium]|nr:ABC transporter substrate-binding protein [Candidatus Spechtbacterales bacterium]